MSGARYELLRLASTSPQRRAILKQLGIPFEVVAPDYVEHDPPDVDPVELVRAHAEGKASSVHVEGTVTLGVDTTVHLDGRVYGKPRDARDACDMLRRLAGTTHAVVSAIALIGPDFQATEVASTEVRFRTLSQHAIEWYASTGEWEGRAGGYAIQGRGGRLVSEIRGDYLNVVGLPAATLVELLELHAPQLLYPTG